MKAETLKKSILQYAMQGKLVAQDPNDEPASELLKRIKAEKEQLIKDCKIKKEKPLPPIAEDEIPYELPHGWAWVRLSEICNIIMGQSPDGNTVISIGNGIEFHQGKVFFGNKYLKNSNQVTTEPTKIAESNSILLCVRAPVGKINITDRNICIGRGLCSIKSFIEIPTEFLYYLLLNYEDIFVKQATGTTFVAITGEVVKKQIIPLPPLQEQQRIVEKLEEILPLVEEYGKNEEILSEMNKKLPKQIRQSILQYAVQGKLVPQNPTDEPASELLKRIKAEKEQLIKDGKIKKEKPLPPITEDEIPFEIPSSWEWVKLGDLCSINPRNIAEDDLDVGFIPMTRINDGYLGGHTYEIKKWKDIKSGFTHFQTGDVVVAKITPCFQNRKSTIISDIPNKIGAGTTELHVIRDNTRIINMRYLLLLVKTEMFIREGVKNFTGTAGQQRVGKDYIMNYVVPLPPLAEQRRIVTKVEELMAKIECLKG